MVQIDSYSRITRVQASSINSTESAQSASPQVWCEYCRQWAISPDLVQNTDYSSKYYAGKSKEYADSILQDAGFIAVSADLTTINTLAADLTNVDTVAGSIANVDTVAGISSNVTTVAGISSDVTAVSNNANNINACVTNASNINTVAGSITNVNTVATNVSDINTCSTNISDINTCADNIAVITNKANISLDNLNATGKARIAVKQYLITETYNTNDIVIYIDSDNRTKMYRSLVDDNLNNPLTDTTSWEEINLGGSSRNLGEIVPSAIPLTDAGLHLLDGALINGSGIYSDFVDYIAGLVSDYPYAFTTESAWQDCVSLFGVCGKFVYDSVNGTVRLPKITGIVEGTTDLTALGALVQAGLPNITGYVGIVASGNQNGAFYTGDATTARAGGTGNNYYNCSMDASHSSAIYGNSSTVQPQTIKVLFYICIATAAKANIEVDIDEIATDLNGKLDLDATNATVVTKNTITNWSSPSGSYEDLILNTSGTTYTAPYEGWFFFNLCYYNISGVGIVSAVNTARSVTITTGATVSGEWTAHILPVSKGDIVQFNYYNTQFSSGHIGWLKKVGG